MDEEQKTDYWNTLSAEKRPPMLTASRMRKLRDAIWNDSRFWFDIICRHGNRATASQLKEGDPVLYEHCLGNFHGMLIDAWLCIHRKGRTA